MLDARKAYNDRLTLLISKAPIDKSLPLQELIEAESNWSKYVCVLISGYLEQAFKDICFAYAVKNSHPFVFNYVEKNWPESSNMWIHNIVSITRSFNDKWADFIDGWVTEQDLKVHINGLVSWRNKISHGEDNSTTGVTMNSVKQKYEAVNKLLDKLEELYGIS